MSQREDYEPKLLYTPTIITVVKAASDCRRCDYITITNLLFYSTSEVIDREDVYVDCKLIYGVRKVPEKV